MAHCSSIKVEKKAKALKFICRNVVATIGVQEFKHSARVAEYELLLLLILDKASSYTTYVCPLDTTHPDSNENADQEVELVKV